MDFHLITYLIDPTFKSFVRVLSSKEKQVALCEMLMIV